MEIYGYQKSGDDLLELKEMSLLCTIEELGKVIDFLEEVKKTHTMVRDKTDICHLFLHLTPSQKGGACSARVLGS